MIKVVLVKFKNNRKLRIILGIIFLLLMVIVPPINYYSKPKIDRILSSSDYAYLPPEAKNYIKEVYDDNGEIIILTEKNKEDNKPYLNPEYIEYLELNEEERKKVELIPDTYILDYSVTKTYTNSSLPSSYDLRNQNGKNFVSPIKNQGGTSVCWAFASIENVETLYMKNNNYSYSDLVPKFSVRQMDYITSTKYDTSSSHSYLAIDGNWTSGMCNYSSCSWKAWENPDNGNHELGKGGNFFSSSIAMANGITLTDESIMPWHEENKPVYVNEIYGYDKSLYEVNSTINMPTINADSASPELINSYVFDIKTYMMEYGGPFVGTYSPQSTCGFENIDGKKVLKTDDCVNNANNKNLGHAMQIIGWDDNYEYSYCESGTNHYQANSDGTCSKGEPTKGKGAWIIRNSWGTETAETQEYSYVYLTYNSTRLSVGFTTSISDMKTRTWDNNYHGNPWIERKISNGMLSVDNQTKEFNTHNNYSEKIEKIKFLTSSKSGKYNISIITEKKNYNNIATITTNEAGFYTVNLSDKNIILEDKIFSVKVEGENEVEFFKDSISVFTSNISDEPSLETNYISGIKTYEDPEASPSEYNVAFVSSSRDATIKLEHYIKNISDYKKISYKAILDGVDHSRYFFDNYSLISSSMTYVDGLVTATLEASKEDYSDVPVCGLEYTFQILYDNEVIESFPLKRICYNWDGNTKDYTKSVIRFHKNDGSGYYTSITKNDLTNYQLLKADGRGNEYFGDETKFFLEDRYLKSWNTEPDGTGTSYTTNNLHLYDDIDLYAQWGTPHTYKYEYVCGYGKCEDAATISPTAEYGKEITIRNNHFINIEGDAFLYWINGDNKIFYEEEKAKNVVGCLTPFNIDYFNLTSLTAVWAKDYKTVTFNENGGTGTMKGINVATSTDSRLKYNLFTKEGYRFKGWNTEADGTGTSYTDGQIVNLTENITLYAQWEEIKYKITFNANNGTTDTLEQNGVGLTSTKLSKNPFTKIGHNFSKWNTSPDGTGTSYTDEQEISISEDLVLYAMWTPINYEVIFFSNNGQGLEGRQVMVYDDEFQLMELTFDYLGYTFKEWNTKPDGTGTSYSNGQIVKNLASNAGEVVALYAIWVENYEYVISNYRVDEVNRYIDLIPLNTTYDNYIKNFDFNYNYSLSLEWSNNEYIGTGRVTNILKNGNYYKQYINIVRGDINGDGKASSLDYVKVKNHIMKTNVIRDKVYLTAADANEDNKISSLDYVRIKNIIMKGAK
ncbi:MAG: InlB B-repeat-containing protein [Bacilli bacterium]|nr:InlB B-repeat-containing protein [Bacilli bacterium]